MKKIFFMIVLYLASGSLETAKAMYKKDIFKNKNIFKVMTPKTTSYKIKNQDITEPQKRYIQNNATPLPSPRILHGNKKYHFVNKMPSSKAFFRRGHFSTILKGDPRYSTATESNVNIVKSEPKAEGNKGLLVFGKNDPQAEEVALNYIKSWQPIERDNPRNGFIQSIDPKKRNREESREQTTRNWWILTPLLSLFYGTKEEEKDSFYAQNLYQYAIDGEMAQTMTPSGFAQELYKNNLTVEDAIRIQCQMQEEKAFEELCRVAGLTDRD